MYGGMFSGLMNGNHVERIWVARGVVSIGSFLSSEEAERRRVALRASIAEQRGALELALTQLRCLVLYTKLQ